MIMNYVVLEGGSLYLVLALMILLLLIALCALVCAMLSDKRGFFLKNLLTSKNCEIKYLTRENLMLKIKCGEFDIDEE